MRESNWSFVIEFADARWPGGETGEGPMLVMGRSVGALLERCCCVGLSKSSAGVGESAGEDKKVRP